MQSPVPPRVLVSYRRDDSAGFARMVYDRLAERFPARVFMDIEDIEPGTDFVECINNSVRGAAVVVSVIGKKWCGSSAGGKSRILDPYDFVRLEIAMALKSGVRVIPVLLPGAVMPGAEELPDDLQTLLRIQALGLTDAHLEDDIDRLVGIIARHFGEEAEPVTLSGMPHNQGWTVSLYIRDSELRGIFVRIDSEAEFRSTGFEPARSSRTGLPIPRSHFELPQSLQNHELEIKYIDARGQDRGPFHLRFDAAAELVRSTRDVLNMVPWVQFGRAEDGHCLIYFSGLLVYKNAFREIRYSVDSEALDQSLKFERVESSVVPGIGEGDQIYLQLPPETRFVCVKLLYVDGSESELGRFSAEAHP